MLRKMIGKLKSVSKKNLARFRARKAVRDGLFDDIDRSKLTSLRKENEGHYAQKYHDKFEHSLVRNAERLYRLGLDKGPKLRIFDIGSGFGYFMYGAQKLGHQPVGLDLPDEYLLEVTALLGLKKVLHRIEPFQPLPDIPGGPFDLITAFATCFDNAGFPGQWGAKEWRYFMKDLRRFMAPRCKVHFKFNQYLGQGTRSGIGCRTVTEELWEYFHALGGTFDKRTMEILDAPARLDAEAKSR